MGTQTETGKAGILWAFRMAWRDARRHRRKLGLFSLSVVVGVAAVTAVNSFSTNLREELRKQSRELLSADVVVRSDSPFAPEVEALFPRLDADFETRSLRLRSMVAFPSIGGARLVEVYGVGAGFPLNGSMDTKPEGASVAGNSQAVAVIEDSVLLQFQLKPGDPIKVGNAVFEIIGSFSKMPGESALSGSFVPRVLIPLDRMEATGLIQFGSQSRYQAYFSFNDGAERASALLKKEKALMDANDTRYTNSEMRENGVGRTMDQIKGYLGLVALASLLLGGAGIAGSAQSYLSDKRESVAALRCLGATMGQCLAIYGIQLSATGLVGAAAGGALGVAMHLGLPLLVGPLLPVAFAPTIAMGDVLGSVCFGWLIVSLFALGPLLPMRRISPLQAIRAGFSENSGASRVDFAQLGVYAAVAGLALAFTWLETGSKRETVYYGGGLAAVILALVGSAIFLRRVFRTGVRAAWPYTVRQGVSNLYRPGNRTTLVVATIGLGACMIYTLFLSQKNILAQAEFSDEKRQSNLILFDIQPDQVDGVSKLMSDAGQTDAVFEPIVTMRLQSFNGESVSEIRDRRDPEIEGWALRREYRSTYRDYLREDEKLLEGEFIPRAPAAASQPVPISVEGRLVEALKLKIGDTLVWDVQGLPVESRVASIREVNWRELTPNFFVVFPAGVLEPAPAMFITGAYVEDVDRLVKLQGSIVSEFPNVSSFDLRTLIATLQGIFDQAAFAIGFIASFTIITGIIVLAATIVSSRYQRVRESVLLRTLGASSGQIRAIMAVEYALIGTLSALSGIGLSLIAGWAVTKWIFKVPFSIPWPNTLAAIALVALLTLAVGLAYSRGIARRSPLESIRAEA